MSDPQTEATNTLAAIPFESVIGSPLVAAVDAQALAAQSTINFITAVGFEEGEDGGEDTVRTVTFKYTSGDASVDLVVPLLAIVPIPYIRIDTMSINFKANISAETNTSKTSSSELTVDATSSGSYKTGWGFTSAKVNFDASVSSKKDSTATSDSKYAVEYTMDVSLHAVQDDMPAGLAKVLNILTESIELVEASSDAGEASDPDEAGEAGEAGDE